MKTGLNWRKFTRGAKNGLTTKATYHGTYVSIDFIIINILYLVEFILNLYSIKVNQAEIKYEFSPSEPFRGPIEYNKSYLKVNSLIIKPYLFFSLV